MTGRPMRYHLAFTCSIELTNYARDGSIRAVEGGIMVFSSYSGVHRHRPIDVTRASSIK
jgi:hypothetical protein